MRAKILSYSRSHGVFAGLALTGATLLQDKRENQELYGKPLSNRQVIKGQFKPPAAAADLIALLNKYHPAKRNSETFRLAGGPAVELRSHSGDQA